MRAELILLLAISLVAPAFAAYERTRPSALSAMCPAGLIERRASSIHASRWRSLAGGDFAAQDQCRGRAIRSHCRGNLRLRKKSPTKTSISG